MDLKLQDGSIVRNCKKVTHKSEIVLGKRAFYELRTPNPTGIFKELTDIGHWLEGDKELEKTSYINHHNFHIEI
jgi:predicted transport protein